MKLTLLLIAVNAIVFIYSITNLDYFINTYGFNINNFLSGDYKIIITSMFLHANLKHLLGNMIALFFLGWTIERNTKRWQYILVYFASGILGNLVAFIPIFGYSPSTIAIGASAAISGLVGLGTFVCPSKFVVFPSVIPLPFVVAGAIYLLVNFSGLLVPSAIGYLAHVGGMFGGAMFGLAWGENRIKRLSVFIILLILISTLPLLVGYFI